MVECEYSSYERCSNENNSFNRYMVECEFLILHNFYNLKSVLIDTWWNVNDETGVFITALGASFNRYMVECE